MISQFCSKYEHLTESEYLNNVFCPFWYFLSLLDILLCLIVILLKKRKCFSQVKLMIFVSSFLGQLSWKSGPYNHSRHGTHTRIVFNTKEVSSINPLNIIQIFLIPSKWDKFAQNGANQYYITTKIHLFCITYHMHSPYNGLLPCKSLFQKVDFFCFVITAAILEE